MLQQSSTLFDLPVDFACFGSGSSGNCYYLRQGDCGLLIDAGVGERRFKKAFMDYGFNMAQIKAILLTHEHLDHTRCAGRLSKKNNLPVYSTASVFTSMRHNPVIHNNVPAANEQTIQHGTPFQIGPFCIEPFKVPHDSSDNTGYFITCGNVNFCLITDCGSLTPDICHYVSRAQHLVVEANYDRDMLQNGPYPEYLKLRILSKNGHMDNAVCGNLLRENLTPSLIRNIWLCHLSQENNTPEKALATVNEAIEPLHLPCKAVPLHRIEPTGPFVLRSEQNPA